MFRGRVYSVSTEEDSDERWRRVHAALPDEYHHSVLHLVDVMMTDDRTAFVTVDSTDPTRNTIASMLPKSQYLRMKVGGSQSGLVMTKTILGTSFFDAAFLIGLNRLKHANRE